MLTALVEQIVNGTMIGCIYVLVALGMVLIFGVMQVLNFAHGVLFMAFFAALLWTTAATSVISRSSSSPAAIRPRSRCR